MFAKGRTTLATREEKHFEGEKNTLNHIKFVTQSMLDLFEGRFDTDLPFVSEARASLQNQKDLMVLAAMFHDAAKPYRHGDIHGWESADILRDILGVDYNNRLAEWAIRHHMSMPFSHKAEFSLSNPEAIEVAKNMARDAKRMGIDE
jgi:UTP:GlnB (protein PII) uridylyltransferase